MAAPTETDLQQILDLVRQRRAIIRAESIANGTAGRVIRPIDLAEAVKRPGRSPQLEAVHAKARGMAERLGPDGMDAMSELMINRGNGRDISALERLWEGVHGWLP